MDEKKNEQKNERKRGMRHFWKRASAIIVSAAVFGMIAGGVFQFMAKDTLESLREARTNQGGGFSEMIEMLDTISEVSEPDEDESTDAPAMISTTAVVNNSGQGMDVSNVVKEVMPSVVSVSVTAIQEYSSGWFGSYEYEAEGAGSGIIISENETELLIVTNNHVVSGAKTVNVGFIDGSTYEAKVKGTDSDNDLAIIVVSLEDLTRDTIAEIKIAKIGNSDELEVGQQVIAIGNALGYGQSVTTGIISAKDRETDTNTIPLIQTDAAINPGNSGGALINMSGEVIGINSSKFASTDVEGMGYAIPITQVESNLSELMSLETREKVPEEKMGYLGIQCQTVGFDMIYYYGAPSGVYVAEIIPGGGAFRAGLPAECIITKLGGQSVASVDELTGVLEYYAAGEDIEVVYQVLEDNEYVEKSLTITLGKKPKNVS